jgi:GNAT superfamily N-acetyltransferase
MVKIVVVNPAEWIDKVRPMLDENWHETGFDFPFDPDVAFYQLLYDREMAFAVGAFDGDNVVGYCTVMVVSHPHNPSVKIASNDGMFVLPKYRNGLTSGRIIKFAEAQAKHMGATRFTWHCRSGTAFADMLQRKGYKPVDIVVMRDL